MWCDNCLLLFPLRAGAMVLASFIALYSLVGGIVLFRYGEFLWFQYPEVQIYGGVSMAVAASSILLLIALSNQSSLFTSFVFVLYPSLVLVSVVRAGVMVFRLDYYQYNVIWDCDHAGQLYNATLAHDPSYSTASIEGNKIPSGFCGSGFHTLYLAFTFSLCIDVILQLYQYFLLWRFKTRLDNYSKMVSTGGVYTP